MQFWDVLYLAAKKSNVRITKLSESLGLSRGYISACKAQDARPQIDNACKLLEGCGYGLFAMRIDSAPTDAMRISYAMEDSRD